MKHPELIENLGRIKPKKDRSHDYGKFQCPFCPKTFISRVSDVINEHTVSCGCRKKKNFVEHCERKVRAKLTSQALAALFRERAGGANLRELCKKYGIPTRLFSTAIRLAASPQRQVCTPMDISLAILKRADELELKCPLPN